LGEFIRYILGDAGWVRPPFALWEAVFAPLRRIRLHPGGGLPMPSDARRPGNERQTRHNEQHDQKMNDYDRISEH